MYLSELLPPELWVEVLDNLPIKVLLRTQREPYLNLVIRTHLYKKLQKWAVDLVEKRRYKPKGVINLVAGGAQDVYLNVSPDITFFNVRYRSRTNYSM